jgi:hypothetical protein
MSKPDHLDEEKQDDMPVEGGELLGNFTAGRANPFCRAGGGFHLEDQGPLRSPNGCDGRTLRTRC